VQHFENTYTALPPALSSSPPRQGVLPADLEASFVGFEWGTGDPDLPAHPPIVARGGRGPRGRSNSSSSSGSGTGTGTSGSGGSSIGRSAPMLAVTPAGGHGGAPLARSPRSPRPALLAVPSPTSPSGEVIMERRRVGSMRRDPGDGRYVGRPAPCPLTP
jgi:hypothetical protein